MMFRYSSKNKLLLAVDCIIFGFDGFDIKVLLIKRGFTPEKGKWSLMGGFLDINETLEQAAIRVLHELTGLKGVYMEQLKAFSDPDRDPQERTVSQAFFALIDIHKYEQQINQEYHAEWFPIKERPKLIFDHEDMVKLAQKELRYQAALHPILFELLPDKFTIPQLQNLYQAIYDTEFDNRNFSRKVLSTGLLIKQKEKDKENSKKGAFYYKLNKRKYKANFNAFLNFVPNPDPLIS